MKAVWRIVKETIAEFNAVPTLSLGAATAYYAAFSIGPLLVLAAALAGLAFGQDHVQNEVHRQLEAFVGPRSASLVESMMRAQFRGGNVTAVLISGSALVFGATGVFSQLQASLNSIWGVTSRPGNGLWLLIRDRLLSMALVLAIGFLLLVSMVLSAFVNAFTNYVSNAIALPDWSAPAFDGFVSFAVISI